MLIKRHSISESFSFAAWQRLQELGLGEEGIEAKRIELHRHLVSELFGEDAFCDKLIELGLAILKISITQIPGYNLKQSIALAGPAESFEEFKRWWKEETGTDCPLYQHLEWHHANSPLVKDRWETAIANRRFFAIGAFAEPGARL